VLVRELGTRADPTHDRITVDGKRIARPRRPKYYVIYKPRGVVSTTRDAHAKRTVLDLVPTRTRLFPVGRLDAASEGLLLLTNDGTLAQVLLHPSFEVPRTYRVIVAGSVGAQDLRSLTRGISIQGRVSTVQSARTLERGEDRSVLELTLTEGRRRQIRELMQAIGNPVKRLVRIRFGPLRLRGLKSGQWRSLSTEETQALERMVEQARQSAASTGAGARGRNSRERRSQPNRLN
jgi:23S rRNA pseudouridine2605 synthase